uniref:Uncharacterized protein n=1 Tax=Macrostomum lignano TaxID=282301 RepID=A0A1I8FEA4_9PLAT
MKLRKRPGDREDPKLLKSQFKALQRQKSKSAAALICRRGFIPADSLPNSIFIISVGIRGVGGCVGGGGGGSPTVKIIRVDEEPTSPGSEPPTVPTAAVQCMKSLAFLGRAFALLLTCSGLSLAFGRRPDGVCTASGRDGAKRQLRNQLGRRRLRQLPNGSGSCRLQPSSAAPAAAAALRGTAGEFFSKTETGSQTSGYTSCIHQRFGGSCSSKRGSPDSSSRQNRSQQQWQPFRAGICCGELCIPRRPDHAKHACPPDQIRLIVHHGRHHAATAATPNLQLRVAASKDTGEIPGRPPGITSYPTERRISNSDLMRLPGCSGHFSLLCK